MIYGYKTILRGIEREDLDLIWKWYNDREVMYYWAEPYRVVTRDELAARYQDGMSAATGRSHWLFITTTDGTPIGRVGYVELDHRNRRAELAIQIGEPRYWGQGYGSDALRAFLGYLFDGLNMWKAWLQVSAANERARRAYHKCGFQEDGILRAHTYLDGRYVDVVVMSILEPEYRSLVRRGVEAGSTGAELER